MGCSCRTTTTKLGVSTATEQKTFSREQLEAVAKFSAQNEIVDGFYVGEFQGQTASWNPDGSLTIVTRHVPSSLEELKKTKAA